ncbi:hypothetical protein Tco_1033509 [Tanacetum coccineum]
MKNQSPIYRIQETSIRRIQDIDFEDRLGKIHDRQVYMVQVVFTSHAWRALFEIRGPLVRELILEFFSTFRIATGVHFGILTKKSLRELTMVVALGPERQQDGAAAGAAYVGLEVAEKGVEADPAPAEAPQVPQATAPASKTMPKRMQRLEEEVNGSRDIKTK